MFNYSKQFLLLVSFTAVLSLSITAQIPSINTLAPSDVWNLTMNAPRAMKVYLLGEISDQNNVLLNELRSESIWLQQGANTLSSSNLKTIKSQWHDDQAQYSVVSTGNFPKGSYKVCTKIVESATDKVIGTSCRNVVVDEALKFKKSNEKTKPVHAYGSASIDLNYASPKPYITELPSSFARFQLEQGLSLYSFPISGAMRFTTEKTETKRDVDMFSLRFDRARFERNVKEMLLKKVAEIHLKKIKLNEADLMTLTEYEQIESKIKDLAIQKINQEIADTKEKLTKVLNDKTNEYTAEYKNKLRSYYDRLQAQKRKYEQLKSRYEQLKKTYDTWITSGRLEELKQLVYNPPQFSDPQEMLPYLKQFGAYTGMNKFLFNIKELSIGTAFPTYSPLTLNGIQLFGAAMEWNPGLFYVAACGGKVHSAVPFYVDTFNAQFKQNLAAARLGFGRIHSSYVSLNFLRFWDKDSSIATTARQEFYPEQSIVLSSDFNLSFGKNKLIEFGGELAGLYAKQNLYDTLPFPAQAVRSSFINSLSKFDALKPNLSSSLDFAYNAQLGLNLFKDNTHLNLSRNFAGPGYNHPGVFGLPNDLQRTKLSVEQEFMADAMTVSLYYANDFDNFSNAKSYPTERKEIGLDAKISSKVIPQLNVRYARSAMKNEFYYFNSDIVQLTASKHFVLPGKSSTNSTINAMVYTTSTDSITNQIHSVYFFISQMLNLPKGFAINLSGQYSSNAIANLSSNVTGFNLGLGKTLFKRIRLQTAVSTNNQSLTGSKLGWNINLNGLIIPNMEFNLRAYQNNYSQYPQQIGPYSERLIQMGIRYSW
ncbi:MAG TPA: hypothetical protein PK006_12540 [Saprospiraceae bacterium]|nr:hypothetical protein [Saprospiraceae bacterium]